MPVAAVPDYLRRHLSEANLRAASPALRFGLLLPVWTSRDDQKTEVKNMAAAKSKKGQQISALLQRWGMDEVIAQLLKDGQLPGLWEKNDHGARSAWKTVAQLSAGDRDRMRALLQRQESLCRTLGRAGYLRLEAQAVAPFTTGLGNEHPLENGFAFLNPYGLPYLPGSGVKGVLRQAARELAQGIWGDPKGWSEEPRYDWPLRRDPEQPPLKLSMLDVLFGRETAEGEQEHLRGALAFWDVIPQIKGESLLVEIMTPHYTHYYQQKQGNGEQSSREQQPRVQSPHDSGQPNPICFLTVPPGARFVFCVTCDTTHLKRTAPDLAEGDRWKGLLEAAFEHAFRWLGFGAKTAVGYGAMKAVQQAPATDRMETAVGAKISAGPSRGRPTEQTGWPAETVWQGATLKYNPSDQSISAVRGNLRSAPLGGKAAQELLQALGEQRAGILRSGKSLENVSLRIQQQGNLIKILGLAE